MPLYDWEDKKTGLKVTVYRERFSQFAEPPQEEELPDDEKDKEREWEKIISPGIKTVRGNSWGGSKGNW